MARATSWFYGRELVYSGRSPVVPRGGHARAGRQAVIGVTHDRYIYLVGGSSKNGPVNNVQVYDAEKNTWSQATAFPGTPVFGHAGGLTDDTIVYVDGAKKDRGRQWVHGFR